MARIILLAIFCSQSAVGWAAEAPVPAVESTAQPGQSAQAALDVLAEPPPSAYDRLKNQPNAESGEASQEIAWGGQILRTIGALGLVVALIYLLFKVGLAKFVGKVALRPSKNLRVTERVQLDGRHALLVVSVDNRERLLLATGEQGVQLIARLDVDSGAAGSVLKTNFAKNMESASRPKSDSAVITASGSSDVQT